MRWLPLALALMATPAFAQDEPGFFERMFSTDSADSDIEQGSLLERLIEDSLSDAGRIVTVTGFSGALSGAATLDSLTIADADGIWLKLTDATLDWNRAALFSGRLEVTELLAREILLPRLATAEATEAPSPEARGFQLPDLPVSVEIGRIAAARVELGEPVIGVAAELSLEGAVSLASGSGAADVEITRLDQPGAIKLDASYENATRNLSLDLSMVEGAGGILATLADLPGAPSVDFTITGDAPLTEFSADIRLATDGAERLAGQVRLGETEEARQINASISGDIAPVFAPQYRDFFGNNLILEAETLLYNDGRVVLPAFSLFAQELALFGSLELGADGVPQIIDVTGRIAPENGDTVRLPIAGDATEISRANLAINFNAATSQDWRAVIRLANLARNGLSVDEITLRGTGRIGPGTPVTVTSDLDFDVEGLFTTDGLSNAVGPNIAGQASIGYAGGPITLSDLTLAARDLALNGSATVEGSVITAEARATADRVANFAELAGRALSGRAALEISGRFDAISQVFDVTAQGQTEDLAVGDPRADAILAGPAGLRASAERDEAGLRINVSRLESAAANLTAEASFASGGSSVAINGRLIETSIVLPGLTGASDVTFAGLEDDARDWNIATTLEAPSLSADLKGLLSNIYDLPAFQGRIDVSSPDISVFSELAGRTLSGQFSMQGDGGANADLSRALFAGAISGRDITVEGLGVDRLLAGRFSLELDAGRTENRVDINSLSFTGESMNAQVSGVVTDLTDAPVAEGRATASSTDLSVFSALAGRALSGQLSFEGEGRARADLTEAAFDGALRGRDITVEGLGVDRFLAGPVTLEIEGSRSDDRIEIANVAFGGEALIAQVSGSVTSLTETPTVEGRISASSADLSVFSGLARRQLAGRLNLVAEGGGSGDLEDLSLDASVQGQNIAIGIAQVDSLLRGALELTVDAARNGDRIEVSDFSARTDSFSTATSGELGQPGDRLSVTARLADIGPYIAGFSGAVSVDGTVGRDDSGVLLDIRATGPGGTEASVEGRVAEDASAANLSIDGTAPLALANQFIAPRNLAGMTSFDLRLDGPPALESLSGRINLANARLAAPTLPTGLSNISGGITLSGGRAALDIDSTVDSGGTLSLTGPVGLTAPNTAALRIALQQVRVTDGMIYETVADGEIRADGALAGGAAITGGITLGETNVQIPSSGLGGSGAIPEITHLREPPPVRGTRKRAGLLERAATRGERGGPVYPLDVRISAPNRIFVRGRGLDSEFGGAVRVTGTTANIVPIGAFELIRGRLDILGQRLALDEARITVEGGLIPVLDIRASTDVEDTEIGVEVLGQADSPEIRFSSSPELPEEEVLARLIFGRGLETLSPIQAARLALAVRTLSGQGGEGLVGNIRGTAGLADLDVTTNEDGNAAVRAGAYLGENIYSDVTVDSAGETQLNLNLDVSPSLTVRGGVTNEGSSSLGIFFERDY